jgi:hypothetical protein
LQDRGYRDGGLEPGQLGAEAVVDAGGEGEVGVEVAAHVEPVGIGEHPRVAVGGADEELDDGAGGEGV